MQYLNVGKGEEIKVYIEANILNHTKVLPFLLKYKNNISFDYVKCQL